MLQALPNPAQSAMPEPAPPTAPAPRVTFNAPNIDWLLIIAIQHWRQIATVTAVLLLGTLLALPFLTPQYEVSAAVLFKLGREQAPEAVSGTGPAAAPTKRNEDVVSEIEIIRSQPLIEELVKSFGLDYFLAKKPPETLLQYLKAGARVVTGAARTTVAVVLSTLGIEKRLTPFEQVVNTLQASISAEAVKRTDVIEVRLLAADQKVGVDVLNKLLELFLAEHIRAHQTPGAKQFLVDRVEALKTDLARLEQERRDFGKSHAIWDLEEQRKSLLTQQRSLLQDLARTREDIGRTGSEVQHAEVTLKTAPKEKRTSRIEQANPVTQSLQLRLADQKTNLERLKLTYGTASNQVRETETDIQKIEQMLAQNSRAVMSSETFEISAGYLETERTMMERKRRLAGLAVQEQRQNTELERTTAELASLDAVSEEWRRLQRDFSMAEQGYQLYARRLEESRISEALDAAQISNVSIIAKPSASLRPVKPKPKLLLAGALAAGLFGTFGFFLLRDAIRPVVHSRETAIEVLGSPVLVRLPEVRT